jgi:hypothetical protein
MAHGDAAINLQDRLRDNRTIAACVPGTIEEEMVQNEQHSQFQVARSIVFGYGAIPQSDSVRIQRMNTCWF